MPEISEEELARLKADSEEKARLEATKKRLEEEANKTKKRAQDAEAKLSEAEKAKLEAEGNTKELLEKEKERARKLEEDLKNTRGTTLREKLKAEVSKVAKDAHNVDMLLKVSEHKDLLKLDEENLTVAGVEEFVSKARETHAYLFGSKHLPDYDNKKGGDDGKGGEGDPDNSMSDEEKYRAELKNVSSRKELAELRKKYGKELDNFDQAY